MHYIIRAQKFERKQATIMAKACALIQNVYNKQQLTAELFSRNILGWVLLLTICNQFKSQITKFDR